MIEFEIMELEYFISPKADWKKIFEQWLEYIYGFAQLVGLEKKKFYNNELSKEERAHYSRRTIDIEYQFPWGRDELWAIAYRTDYDLSGHQKKSKEDLTYFDEAAKERYIPHVIEPTFGLDRTFLAVLAESYKEEKERVVLGLVPRLAPYKAAVFPLLANRPELVNLARKVYEDLSRKFYIAWDERGNIGKRYYSQDEIGTPWCITVDFESLKDETVTIRDRETTKQERIKIKDVSDFLEKRIEG